jgi:hypothetical protein
LKDRACERSIWRFQCPISGETKSLHSPTSATREAP